MAGAAPPLLPPRNAGDPPPLRPPPAAPCGRPLWQGRAGPPLPPHGPLTLAAAKARAETDSSESPERTTRPERSRSPPVRLFHVPFRKAPRPLKPRQPPGPPPAHLMDRACKLRPVEMARQRVRLPAQSKASMMKKLQRQFEDTKVKPKPVEEAEKPAEAELDEEFDEKQCEAEEPELAEDEIEVVDLESVDEADVHDEQVDEEAEVQEDQNPQEAEAQELEVKQELVDEEAVDEEAEVPVGSTREEAEVQEDQVDEEAEVQELVKQEPVDEEAVGEEAEVPAAEVQELVKEEPIDEESFVKDTELPESEPDEEPAASMAQFGDEMKLYVEQLDDQDLQNFQNEIERSWKIVVAERSHRCRNQHAA